MRDIVGEVTLDELLSKRDEISKRIQQIVDKATDAWGIKVESVDVKHVELPRFERNRTSPIVPGRLKDKREGIHGLLF